MSATGSAKGGTKTGGRKKGTPNKMSAEAKKGLAPLLGAYVSGESICEGIASLERDLAMMEPGERVKAIAQYLPYVMPKLSAVEVKQEKERKSYQDELDEMTDTN